MAISQEYRDALRNSPRQPIYKIEWMNKDELVTDEIITDLLTGSLSVERKNGIRRSARLELENDNGSYTPTDSDGLIWIGKKFKLYTGLNINGTNYFNAQGIFNLGNPRVKSESSFVTSSIEAYDNFALLDGKISGKLENTYIISVGTLITDAVKAVFNDAGIIKPPIVAESSATTPYTITEKFGSTYSKILEKLAGIISWDIYFDIDGYPRFEPRPGEENKGSIWEFRTDEVTYNGMTHNYDLLSVKNKIKVIGDNINGNTFSGTAEDTNPFSPTNADRVGVKFDLIEDDLIYSDALAEDRAEYELKNRIQVYENADLSVMPVDIIQEGDIVIIDDSEGGFDRARCLVTGFNLNLDFNSQQTLNVWKARETS